MKRFGFLFLLAASIAFAEPFVKSAPETMLPELLAPEEKSFIEKNHTSIRISASKKKASVFINDEYFGTTPLTIEDLTPATYVLKVEKQGSEAKSFLIEVKSDLHQEFFVEL